MVIESSLPESLISALDIRSSSNIQDAVGQTGKRPGYQFVDLSDMTIGTSSHPAQIPRRGLDFIG